MPRPIVEVLQSVATIQTTVTDPTQATLIVGPNYNIIPYDSSATNAENAAAEIGEFNPYGYGATEWPSGDVVLALDERGDVNPESIKVYLDNVKVEVGASSHQKVSSTYGGNATTTATLKADVADWSYKIQHETTFRDLNVRDLQNGDTVQIQYPFANSFVPNDAGGFSDAILDLLADDTTVVTVAVPTASQAVADTAVFWFADRNRLNTSKTHVDLFTGGAEALFEVLVAGVLNITDGIAATLTVDGTAINGTLNIPHQTTVIGDITQASDSRDYICIADRVRQYVNPDLADNLQKISARIENDLSQTSFSNTNQVFLPNEDADWSYSRSTLDLTFNNDVTLRDTDLANAATLVDKAITSATIYIASKSLNTSSFSSAITISPLNLESELGLVSSENPLALAASIALQNSGTSSIRVMRVSEDSSEGFLSALPYINANPDVYAVLPLTQDLSVINSYAVAAVNQSAPEVGKFRIVLGSAETAPLWRYWAGTRASEYGRSASNLASGFITNADKAQGADADAVIVDPEGGYLSVGGPVAGDTVVFNYVDGEGAPTGSSITCEVKSIQSNSQLTVKLPTDVVVAENNSTAILFTGARDIKNDRTAQVEDLLKAIEPLTSNTDLAKRLVMVYPGQVSVGDESGLPGYYLTSAVGGMLSAFEPHRPKNNIALSGIADIEQSNLGYFTDAQIDQLSDGGYFVLIQEIPGGLPFCVHQVTLGYRNYASTQEYSELSVVNNFDFISSVFKNTLEPYVGVWNVVPQAYSSIMASLDSAILNLRSRSVDRIGAPLQSGEVISVEPSEADAGTVNVLMEVQLPKVLNKIRLEIVSQ